MPEGHVLHHLTREHQRRLGGQRVRTSSPQGRFTEGADALDGQVLVRAEAKGKHAFYRFGATPSCADGPILHVHLGLYGRFRSHKAPPPEPRGAVRLRLVGDDHAWDLIGPAQCALLSPAAAQAKLDSLGEDPLRDDANPARVLQILCKTRRTLGAVLLDQSVIAGVGNVYRSELAFLAGVSPSARSCDLSADTHAALWANSVTLLRIGTRHNAIRVVGEEGVIGPVGGEAVDSAARTQSSGARRDRLWVYKCRACRVCGTPIVSAQIAARTAYLCPTCQPGPAT
ncbi:MAG: endonuclease-8 [Myxococcota bacterium]|jgi:endonuclease-8